jgi:puromycin-sensitive aminopeptidase
MRGAGKSRKAGAREPKRRGRRATRRGAHRLGGDVLPSSYEIDLDVDPERGGSYRGEVAIRVALRRATRRIELHAAELRVGRAVADCAGRTLRARVEPLPERETVALHFPERLAAGEVVLRLGFAGRLRSDLRGLYAAASGRRRYAFTQLEAADARHFFPCFDEPAMKARFRLAVTTAPAHAVVSNAPVERTVRKAGRKTVHFAWTPPLSTYLVALAVGDLECSRPVRLGPTEIRVWHVPGKGRLTRFALEAARECLERLEDYFALPYPYAKLDLVAVPDFEAGAMENAGAVFFRETLLLLDPETATPSERKRAAEVICHELAHMWYGDLVTMAWWDDLWLNEAFATWMAFHVVDRWKPEWHMWHDFQHHRAAALRLDALRHTHPIHTEVGSPAEATENFDLITYEKGASVVRMLERYLGPVPFRKGVRRYIRRHRESNAVAADLWRALSEAAGQPVEPIVRGWIDQAGLPVLSLWRVRERGREWLRVAQERFSANPRRSSGRQRWPIPWVGRAVGAGGRTRRVRQLVERTRERIDLGPGRLRFVYGNADEGGFFRPLHDRSELAALTEAFPELPTVERMGLVDHLWALARAARAPLGNFLRLLDAADRERDPDVLLTWRGPLAFLEDRLAPELGPAMAARFRDRIADVFGSQLTELGWRPARGEDDVIRQRRGVLVGILGEIADWPPVVEAASARFEAVLERRGGIDPSLADPIVSLGARHGGPERYTALQRAVETAPTPQERRRFLLALADFRAPRLIDRTLAASLTPRIPTQDVAFVLVRLLANPAARERAWRFVKRRWSTVARRMPPMLVTRLIDTTPVLGPGHRREVAAFFRAHPVPAGARSLDQALERFDLDAAFCRLARPELARWLGKPTRPV